MKTIFWNVDTQYDFMRNDDEYNGKLAIPGAHFIEENLSRLTSLARKYNIQIVNTADWHTGNSKEFSQFPPHCLQRTKGAEFIPATRPRNPYTLDWQSGFFDINSSDRTKGLSEHKGDIVIYKDAFDVFEGSPHTQKVLDTLNPKQVIVYGVASDVCVNFAVQGLLNTKVNGNNLFVYVVEDAIKELPGSNLELIINSWRRNGAALIKTKDVETYIIGEHLT